MQITGRATGYPAIFGRTLMYEINLESEFETYGKLGSNNSLNFEQILDFETMERPICGIW